MNKNKVYIRATKFQPTLYRNVNGLCAPLVTFCRIHLLVFNLYAACSIHTDIQIYIYIGIWGYNSAISCCARVYGTRFFLYMYCPKLETFILHLYYIYTKRYMYIKYNTYIHILKENKVTYKTIVGIIFRSIWFQIHPSSLSACSLTQIYYSTRAELYILYSKTLHCMMASLVYWYRAAALTVLLSLNKCTQSSIHFLVCASE